MRGGGRLLDRGQLAIGRRKDRPVTGRVAESEDTDAGSSFSLAKEIEGDSLLIAPISPVICKTKTVECEEESWCLKFQKEEEVWKNKRVE